MRTIIAVLMALILIVSIMPVEGIRISSIDDAYIGEEVTISGVVVTISSNVETFNVHTYEPGNTNILTIDDGSGTIRVCSDTKLFSPQAGERLMVSGIYAGGSIIYADKLSPYVVHGYKDIYVAELKGFPEYYHDHSVRVKGKVKRIELTYEKTKLRIEDDTGTIGVEYRGEIEDIKINEELIVEGTCYRNRIYAVAVESKEKKTVQSSPEQSEAPSTGPSSPEPTPETPAPTPTPTPAATPTPTPTPTPTSASAPNTGLSFPLYLLLIFAVVISVIIVGIFSFITIRQRRV
jgi:DNA/RNA endonuclease YhcR with UshA esterase domain